MISARHDRGFTLLEMLIGMTLLGFILALLYAGLNLGIRSWEAGEARTVTTSRQAVVDGVLRRVLESAEPRVWKIAEAEALAFAGEPERLRFIGVLPVAAGNDAALVALELAPGETGRDLVLRWHAPDPDVAGFGPLDGAEGKALVKAVKEANFAYFGTQGENAEPDWHDQWLDQKTLPDLVRVRLVLDDGEAWPEILVAFRVHRE